MSSHYKHEHQIILLKTKVSDFFFKMANEIESFCSNCGFYQEDLPDKSIDIPKYFGQSPISNYGFVGDFKFNTCFLSTLPIPETATLRTSNVQRLLKPKRRSKNPLQHSLKHSQHFLLHIDP